MVVPRAGGAACLVLCCAATLAAGSRAHRGGFELGEAGQGLALARCPAAPQRIERLEAELRTSRAKKLLLQKALKAESAQEAAAWEGGTGLGGKGELLGESLGPIVG